MPDPFEQKDRVAHEVKDTDLSWNSPHHTLGHGPTQAAPGNHTHEAIEINDIPDTSAYLVPEEIIAGEGITVDTTTEPGNVIITAETGPTGPIDHGTLTGLADDDHTQYVKKAGDTMTGNLTVATPTGGTVSLDSPAGTNRTVRVYSNGVQRWLFGGNTTTEPGDGSGTDFGIYRYNDAGGGQASALIIERATGKVTIPNLKAGFDEWIEFTPSVFNAVRSSSDCWYYRTPGGLVHVEVRITVNSVSGNTYFTLPVVPLANSHGHMVFEDISPANHYPGYCMASAGNNYAYVYWILPATGNRSIIGATTPFTWAAGDIMRGSITYRAAAL